MKRNRYLVALLAVLAIVLAACGGGDEGSDTTDGGSDTTAAGGGGDEDLVIGFSWNNFNEERWSKFDEPAFVAAIEEGGAQYIKTDAASSEEQQLADVENLINQGADVIVILAQNTEAILPAVESAASQGIPVIAYDRLIEDERALYLTFDNVGVGRIMAEVLFEQVNSGNFAIIKGNGADANSDFLRAGMEEVIGDAVAAGDITIVCEEYTDDWLAEVAQETMENCLTQNNNDIQAALVENDGMAGGVVAALEAQGLAGQIPVTGQDGDAAALNRVALGTQLVSVWKDARVLGQIAGEAALALAGGAALADIENTVEFESPGGNTMISIFLDPNPITQDNLQEVIDAEVITQEDLCQGVEAGSVEACP
ncbi:MAG TPA: substrate-binding domain-containing protein [Acidimicrobiia bacterium]|nr:substrate-binding domain-containing protein [Acidimicrobiia bacterium]